MGLPPTPPPLAATPWALLEDGQPPLLALHEGADLVVLGEPHVQDAPHNALDRSPCAARGAGGGGREVTGDGGRWRCATADRATSQRKTPQTK